MHSQSKIISYSDDSITEDQGSVFSFNFDIDDITVAYAVSLCISRSHMDMSLGSDDAFLEFDLTGRADQLDAVCTFDIT